MMVYDAQGQFVDPAEYTINEYVTVVADSLLPISKVELAFPNRYFTGSIFVFDVGNISTFINEQVETAEVLYALTWNHTLTFLSTDPNLSSVRIKMMRNDTVLMERNLPVVPTTGAFTPWNVKRLVAFGQPYHTYTVNLADIVTSSQDNLQAVTLKFDVRYKFLLSRTQRSNVPESRVLDRCFDTQELTLYQNVIIVDSYTRSFPPLMALGN